jgi:hypothetical protein
MFSPKTFNLPITLSYSPEWSVAEEYSDVFTLSYIGHDAGVSFINVKNAKYADGIAFPDDFVTWIQSPDSLFQVVDSKPVLVGGFKGIQINATGACGDGDPRGSRRHGPSGHQRALGGHVPGGRQRRTRAAFSK